MGTNVLNYAPGANTIPAKWKSQQFVNSRSFLERRGQVPLGKVGHAQTNEEKEAFECSLNMEVSALKTWNEEQAKEDAVETTGEVTIGESAGQLTKPATRM